LNSITIDESRTRRKLMENVFLTGDISPNGRTSSISKITELLMEDLKKFKKNLKHKNNNGLNVVYVGEINYTGTGHLQSIQGTSNIWLLNDRHNYRYIVEINKPDDNYYDYSYHVKCALQSLCNLKNSELIIDALKKFSIEPDKSKINELSDEKSRILEINKKIETLKEEQTKLQQQLTDIFILNHSILSDFEWTFTGNQNNQNNQ